MAIVDFGPPQNSRDHEILALSNAILKCCSNHTSEIVLGGLAQAFLFAAKFLQDDPSVPPFPPCVEKAADGLTELFEHIQSLPPESVQ